jgi:DNA polymerase-3 subunit delta
MPSLTPGVLRKQIASGETAPLYVVVGADDLEKSAVANEFVEMVDEGLRAFNVERFYGAEARVDDLVDAASTLPMMVPRRVILVLEAEKLLVPRRESKAAEAELERLEAFIKAPPSHSTVVFLCGALDMRRRAVKLLMKEGQLVNCGSIDSELDAERWIKARAARDKVTFDSAAVRALVERAGLDLVRLRAGFDRVVLYTMGQPSVTAADVSEAVVAGPEAQENFGIANAIQNGDASGALGQLAAALEAGAVPFFLMGQIRLAAERMPSSRVRAAIDAVFRTDVALKSSGGEPRILLERLVVELCGASGAGRSFAAGRWQK